MSKSTSHLRALVECALLLALGTVLDGIKIFEMPFGGAITLLSMLPLVIASYRHGLGWGLLTGLAYSLLQMLTGFYPPPSGTIPAFIGVVLLDYVLAFTVLGAAWLFAKPFKNRLVGVIVGAAVVCLLRFVCSWISGAWLWGSYQEYYEWAAGLNVWLYSFIYNANYMLPETILTAIGAGILCKAMPKLFQEQ